MMFWRFGGKGWLNQLLNQCNYINNCAGVHWHWHWRLEGVLRKGQQRADYDDGDAIALLAGALYVLVLGAVDVPSGPLGVWGWPALRCARSPGPWPLWSLGSWPPWSLGPWSCRPCLACVTAGKPTMSGSWLPIAWCAGTPRCAGASMESYSTEMLVGSAVPGASSSTPGAC